MVEFFLLFVGCFVVSVLLHASGLGGWLSSPDSPPRDRLIEVETGLPYAGTGTPAYVRDYISTD